MRSSFVATLAAALVLPLAAQAQDQGGKIAPSQGGRAAFASFKALDANGDRALSLSEMNGRGGAKASALLFQMLDADGDGRLSLREVEGAGGGGRLARFEAMDADKNGYVSRREFPATVGVRLFHALDRDGDGKLSMAELRPAMGGWRVARAKPDHPPVRTARREDDRRPVCWVPNFGDADRWLIEVPVTSAGNSCRTQ